MPQGGTVTPRSQTASRQPQWLTAFMFIQQKSNRYWMTRQEALNDTPRGTGWDHHPVPLVSIHPPWAFSPRGQTPRPHCLISPCDDRIAYVQIHILSFSSLFHRKVCLFLYHFIFLQRIKTIPRMRQIYLHKDSETFAIDRTINGGSEGVVFGTYIRLCENEYQLNISHTSSYNDKKKVLLIKNDSIHGFNGSSYSLLLTIQTG